MDTLDVLFVIAPSAHPDRDSINRTKRLSSPHLGLAYVAATLVENGYTVAIVDLLMDGTTIDTIRGVLQERGPRLVGITATTEAYNNAVRIARVCKQIRPECTTVLGGPHVTFTADQTLAESVVDLVVRDEGEFPMLEIAGYFMRGYGSLAAIDGLSYRTTSGQAVHNRDRQFLSHLDELPFPDRSMFPTGTYGYYNGILTARGCLGRCSFCSAGAMSKGRLRCRSVHSVVDELLFLQRNGVEFVTFFDDNLTTVWKRIEHLCDLMTASGFHLDWAIESRIDTVNPAALRKLGKSGCKYIQFGIESGVQAILNSINKGITVPQIRQILGAAKEAGIQAACSVMLGHPDDTWDTAQETIRFSQELQEEYGVVVSFAVATPFPGTAMFRQAAELGLVMCSTNFDDYTFFTPVCHTRNLRVDQLRQLLFDGYTISNLTRGRIRETAAT